MALVTWLHISDSHVSATGDVDEHGRDPVITALWRDIEGRAVIDPELQSLDFVFFTGDMVSSGRNDAKCPEYDVAFKRFVRPLCEKSDVPLERIYVTPGNHDIDRAKVDIFANVLRQGLQQQEDIHALFTEPVMERARQHLFERQSAYRSFVSDRFRHIQLDEKTMGFAALALETRTGARVNVIGINTAWLAYGNTVDENRLVIGEWQLSRLLPPESDSLPTIALLHHPLKSAHTWFHPMEGTTLKQLRSRVHFILAGHLHEPDVASELSAQGPLVEMTAGAAFKKRAYANSYMYVKYDTATGAGTAYIRIFSDSGPRGPEWHADAIGTGRADGGVPIRLYEPTSVGVSTERLAADLVRRQSADLGNRPLLAGYADRDAMRALFPDVYVDPFVRPRKEPTQESLPMRDWIDTRYQQGDKVLLLGPPGAGKTTALIAIHRKNAELHLAGTDLLPVFVDARMATYDMPLEENNVLPLAAKSTGLDPSCYQNMMLPFEASLILVDGLDEARLQMAGHVGDALTYELPAFPHIAACRLDFYERHLISSEFLARYTEILELEPWRGDRELPRFLEAYFKKVYGESNWTAEMEQFRNSIGETLEHTDLISTPLAATILLFIWRYDRDALGSGVRNSADLLDRFVTVWAKREIGRGNSCLHDSQQFLLAYEIAAWKVSQTRGRVSLADIAAAASNELGVGAGLLVHDSGLRSLLRTRHDPSSVGLGMRSRAAIVFGWLGIHPRPREGEDWTLVSFAHEMLREFLLARRIVRALEGDARARDVLFVAPEHWVNKLAKQLVHAWQPTHRSQAIGRLRHLYGQARHRRGERWVQYRDNVCYFWGRLEADLEGQEPSLPELYWEVRGRKATEHPMVIGTIATGALLISDAKVERDYLDRIAIDGSPDDIRNRKYHLIYYGDYLYEGPNTYLLDSPIRGKDDWERTRTALLRRLSSSDRHDRLLRGLDIVTYLRFCQTRAVPDHAPQQIEILRHCADDLEGIPDDKACLIRIKHGYLMHIVENAK